MKRIYISGKITGLDRKVSALAFQQAESFLIQKYGMVEVVNPLRYKDTFILNPNSWEEYMLRDIKLLFECDTIFMLDNWRESKGARIEFQIAVETNKNILFQ